MTLATNRSMPACTVMPELVVDDVERAAAWLCKVFGLGERWRAGGHRAQLAVGDGAVALTESRVGQGLSSPDAGELGPSGPPEVSSALLVRVADVDAHHEHAREHGAQILQPPTSYPYGERQYTAQDPAGHRWTFSQTIADVAPEEWGGMAGPEMGR